MKRHGTAWKLGISAALLALMGLSAGAFYARRGTASPEVATAAVSRGSIVASVSASGTLEAVTTVTVQIVTLLVGDQEFDSPKTLAAFALGLVLFLVTLALNVLALHIVRKYREQYE